ncbi:MAG: hypothetical protein DMD33_10280 [Gemmatimonadetes bacterium]|nr:MAG: hypothetical protein DMD33_10280 [Gemmatimonadota bacterium]TLY48236.1 MAG: hypothetical protein E6K55_14265 [Gemmatimonadota bacterium]
MSAIARIPAAVGAFAALLVTSYAAPQRTTHRSACATSANGVTLGFAGQFAGVSQDDHKSNLWSGRVSGSMSGGLVVTLEPLGSLMETANPIWQVKTRWRVPAAARGQSSLAAELYGTVNWKTGRMRLSGVVTEGCFKGYEAIVDGRFADLDAAGTLQIQPAMALR